MKFGLIANKEAWGKDLSALIQKGGDAYLVEGRPINLQHYPQLVTPELADYTGEEVGTVMHPIVVQKLGRTVGKHIVANGLYRPVAMDILRECEKRGIRIVFITATPVDLAQGIFDSVKDALQLPDATVLGTEDKYDANGSATQSLFVIGQTKTDIGRASKERGAIALVGAGDKYLTTDAFVFDCGIKGMINNKSPRQGDEDWESVRRDFHLRAMRLINFRNFPVNPNII